MNKILFPVRFGILFARRSCLTGTALPEANPAMVDALDAGDAAQSAVLIVQRDGHAQLPSAVNRASRIFSRILTSIELAVDIDSVSIVKID